MSDVGLVIPNLNQSRFLFSALEGLRHQGVAVEAVLMDGGSTDGVRDAVAPYDDVLAHCSYGPDGGQSAAVRSGLEHVGGDVIGYLNADDYLFPGALAQVVGVFRERPEVDVVYGDAIHVTPDGDFLCYFPAGEPYDARRLTRTCFVCQPACFVRRRAYDRVGGLDPGLRYTMDWDLWCRLALDGARFFRLRAPLAAVRWYPETKTMAGGLARYGEIYRIERRYGRRVLPLATAGAAFYSLSNVPSRGMAQEVSYHLLSWARRCLRCIEGEARARGRERELFYGFGRRTNEAPGVASVRFPWYGPGMAERVTLLVRSSDDRFDVSVNRSVAERFEAPSGVLAVDLPKEASLEWCLDVSTCSGSPWRLMGCSVEYRADQGWRAA